MDDVKHDVRQRTNGAAANPGGVTRRRLDDLGERAGDRRERGAGRREIIEAETLMMRLGQLALSLQNLGDVHQTSEAIVGGAVDIVPGADHAGLSVVSGRQASLAVVTDDVVSQVDRAQRDTGEGPAMTALQERRTVRVDDLATETRWPGFAPRAARAGVGSMLAVRVFVHRDDLGVLTLCSRRPHGFDDAAERIASLLATHAAVAVASARRERDLAAALVSRDVIGQAKGILMERHRLSADQAFAVLTRVSQDTNTKLVDVVQALTETGELGGARPGRERPAG